MADTITPNISLALYRYLCQNIVGTEEHVKTIRLMNIMRDNFSSDTLVASITSGSYGKGLEMRGSDLDFMNVWKSLEVYEDVKPSFNQGLTYFSMETDDVKPCFTLLRLEYIRNPYVFQYCEERNGKYYISSALCKQKVILFGNNDVAIHGPCISSKNEFFDMAVSLHCKTWISPALQWITRSSSSWPNQISNFNVSMWNFPTEPFTSYVNDVEKIVQSEILYYANRSLDNYPRLNIYNTGLIHNISCQQSSLKHLYAYYISQWCSKQAQLLPFDSAIINNKYQYKQYRSCLCTLLTNVYHDAVSGWLMVASFFHKTKQYDKVLHIIRYSLSKCTPEKLYHGMTMSNILYQSLKQQSFHKKSVGYLLKIMHVDSIRFKMNSTLIPDELLMEGWNYAHIFPSTAYAYFLSFLCHYQLNNVRQCQGIIEGLQLVTEENYLIPIWHTADAYNLLGIALELFGDKESARKAFLLSVKIFPDEEHNFAAKRVLLLN
ncbi:unnamed protein product [Mytilus coruscus]|uniref:Mab-21-like HhH/H2TH-like domain-containing protein n=1 Tax=Mytilus coruscus TaxID=42192 RepID=A0A6J8AGN7_MYTCO|nr:unnamed protein product [Mytilus coruscus]